MSCLAVSLSSTAGRVSIDYFQRFVVDGGPITWFVLIPLSIITVAFIIDNIKKIRSVRSSNEKILDEINTAIDNFDRKYIANLVDIPKEPEFVAAVTFRKAISELKVGMESAEYVAMETIEEILSNLLRRIEYLNIIGSVSPMIGLFGTVYGIILAFNKLVEVVRAGGVTQPDQLAEGISIALVTTFWGLVIAIPALAVYGILRNKVESFGAEVVVAVIELLKRVPQDIIP